MTAAAQRQRARILSAMGREDEAVHAQALADRAYAQLGGASRDALAEYLLADDERAAHDTPLRR